MFSLSDSFLQERNLSFLGPSRTLTLHFLSLLTTKWSKPPLPLRPFPLDPQHQLSRPLARHLPNLSPGGLRLPPPKPDPRTSRPSWGAAADLPHWGLQTAVGQAPAWPRHPPPTPDPRWSRPSQTLTSPRVRGTLLNSCEYEPGSSAWSQHRNIYLHQSNQ